MKAQDMKELRNDTTRFILPLLGLDISEIELEFLNNAYILDENTLLLKYDNEDVTIDFNKTIKENFQKFLHGEYRLFDNIAKKLILNFWGVEKGDRLYNILYPKDYNYAQFGIFIDKDIWPKPNLSKEYIKYEINNIESNKSFTESI